MRNRALHDALREFALEAAAQLTHEIDRGAEIPFDVVEEPGGRTVLYNYRPLTSEFIAQRWTSLRALPAFGAAADALGSGAENYLRTQATAASAADSEPALAAMLERIYADATSFEFPEERFERVYAEVERALYQSTLRTAIVAPLHGFEMESDGLDLGDGLFLIAGDKLDAPPAAVWSDVTGQVEHGRAPNVLCVLRRDVAADAPLPMDEARARFRRLLTAMRLFKPGGLAFGPLAWARVDEGTWQPLTLGASGSSRGTPWVLEAEEGPELVELVDLVAAATPSGRMGWALARFEMGSERAHDTEALSDYLLALESLLDARDEAGRATLTLRLAALCAEEGERRAVQRRAELAFALERWVMGGGGANAYLEALGPDTPRTLVHHLEQHLRALLRDVLCGYLGTDLKAAADDVLLTSSEPIEIKATDTRRAPKAAAPPPPPPAPEPEVEPEPDPGSQPVWPQEPVTEKHAVEAGVTASADWDDDPDSYSAPV
ncbi:MAG: hypothetical protein QOF55_1013 [Thermoleophilaceae bacterium]|jgi:hypothetical protein|nr:hypothetical protein [Thermoleophilaceae bacterium]